MLPFVYCQIVHLNSNTMYCSYYLVSINIYSTNKNLVNGRPQVIDTAVLVNKIFIHNNIKINRTSIINTAIQVSTNDVGLILVKAFKSPETIFITTDLDNILISDQNIFIASDLNAQHQLLWNSKSTNSTGRTLFR